MKALVLAAGLGTRLKPHTLHTPKSLFPIWGRPNLDIIISRLIEAGCNDIAVNTHHLYRKIDDFLASHRYPIPIRTIYEPEILGTGGAIKNLDGFWDDSPFFVINSDVVTNVRLSDVYQFHLRHDHPATLVLCDDPEFNTVSVDANGHIRNFSAPHDEPVPAGYRHLTFTGIQVLDPCVLDFIPENRMSSSIDAFKKMMATDLTVSAYTSDTLYWKDIGSPERYMDAVCDQMTPAAFEQAFGKKPQNRLLRHPLKGDGSDRKWYRLKAASSSLVMVDHGIRRGEGVSEFDSFIHIGQHLYEKGIPVPQMFLYDDFSGLVFLEDLGDRHLQDIAQKESGGEHLTALYESIIDQIIRMSINGERDFNPAWAYQSAVYDQSLILERECRYFVDAFLNDYLHMDVRFEDLAEEFHHIADSAVKFSANGFMHRDMQSRNIMITNRQCRFIDFQGGRIGPIQYDLASLLIDPYADLPSHLQAHLLNYGYRRLTAHKTVDRDIFYEGYAYCAICRNLQILGAFGFLTRRKGKAWFEKYIPIALRTLRQNLSAGSMSSLNRLKALVEKLSVL